MHLGTAGCKADFLLDFLKSTSPTRCTSSATSSTAGSCRKGWTWRQSHNDVVQKILRKARKGTRVIYMPGNHDEFARGYRRPRISAASRCVYETTHVRPRTGKRLPDHAR